MRGLFALEIQKRTRGRTLQKLRERHLRARPLCVSCQASGLVTLATELDHITPLHKGGTDADDNLQPLCAECHRVKTARDMGHQPVTGCDADGFPADATHHWRAR